MILLIISLIIQSLIFYLVPAFTITIDPIGMVLLIIAETFVISLLLGISSRTASKYLFPIVTAIIFIPSVFIYYNDSALIHALWYLVISLIGVAIGSLVRKLFGRR